MTNLTINLLIDYCYVEFNLINPVEIAEHIEQYFGKEVNIDYVEFYLEKHDSINREIREFSYYSTHYP